MKKVVFGFLLSILLICCGCCGFLFIATQDIKTNLDRVNGEIKSVKEIINETDTNNKTLTETYEKLLIESSDKLEENQIWKETKEKLEQALSQ